MQQQIVKHPRITTVLLHHQLESIGSNHFLLSNQSPDRLSNKFVFHLNSIPLGIVERSWNPPYRAIMFSLQYLQSMNFMIASSIGRNPVRLSNKLFVFQLKAESIPLGMNREKVITFSIPCNHVFLLYLQSMNFKHIINYYWYTVPCSPIK